MGFYNPSIWRARVDLRSALPLQISPQSVHRITSLSLRWETVYFQTCKLNILYWHHQMAQRNVQCAYTTMNLPYTMLSKHFFLNLDGLMATLLAQTWLFKSKSSKKDLELFLPSSSMGSLIPTILAMVTEEVLTIFPPRSLFLDSISCSLLGAKKKSTSDKWNTGTTTKIMQVANYTNTSNTLLRVLVACWK